MIRKNENLESEKPAFALGIRIRERVKELGINPHILSSMIGMAYDTTRKIHNGETFPSVKTLTKICQVLDLDFVEMQEILRKDKLADKGGIAQEESIHDPIILKLARFFRVLTEENKNEILFIAQTMAIEAVNTKAQHRKKSVA